MAESRGFFRRIFSFGSKEEDRVPEGGEAPRTADTTAKRDDALDAEIHQPAMASTDTDSEAGASADEPAGGGITPLVPRGATEAGGTATSGAATSGTAEKKTPN